MVQITRNILWTGGWDSTFRVLDLTLNKDEIIQPYYVFDKNRLSTTNEIEAMEHIKELINQKNPKVAGNILETKYITQDNIPINNEITNKFKILASKSKLGDQYDWIGRFCESQNIYDMELCIHLGDKAQKFIENDVQKVEKGNDSYFNLNKELSMKELDIFSYYHFPFLYMTKVDMDKISRESGFDDIMYQTWFCFYPKKDGTPCGFCNPCTDAREAGLGRRVPSPTIKERPKYEFKKLQKRIKKALKR